MHRIEARVGIEAGGIDDRLQGAPIHEADGRPGPRIGREARVGVAGRRTFGPGEIAKGAAIVNQCAAHDASELRVAGPGDPEVEEQLGPRAVRGQSPCLAVYQVEERRAGRLHPGTLTINDGGVFHEPLEQRDDQGITGAKMKEHQRRTETRHPCHFTDGEAAQPSLERDSERRLENLPSSFRFRRLLTRHAAPFIIWRGCRMASYRAPSETERVPPRSGGWNAVTIRTVLVLGAVVVQSVSGIGSQGNDASSVIPDPAAFYAAVRANLARAQRAAHEFSYKERRTNLHTNPFGKLGTDGIDLYEVFPSANSQLTYRRLLERDGVPLTDAALTKQDRAYQSKAAEIRRRLQSDSEAEYRRRADEEAQARRRAQEMIEDVVATLQFRITGSTVRGDRPAITVAFGARPDARSRTREGRIAQKFEGTAWIDAERHEVMHVEAVSIDDIPFGFGIVARLGKGTTGSLTRAPVEPDLWMPTRLRLSGGGRALLFLRKLSIDYAVDWFDYQRMARSSPEAP